MQPELLASLYLLHNWLNSQHEHFWPKEETLQGWLAASLCFQPDEGSKPFAAHPTQILRELHLGEPTEPAPEGVTRLVRDLLSGVGKPKGHFRFDLAVLADRPRRLGRDLETLEADEDVRLLIEFKALNSAGQLKRAALQADVNKLGAALSYWSARPGASKLPYALLLVVATACKDTLAADVRDQKVQDVIAWCRGLVLPQGVHTCVVCRQGLYIDAVLHPALER